MKTRIYLITLVIALSVSFADASAQNRGLENSADLVNPQAKISIDKNNLVAVTYPYKIDEDRRKLVIRVYDDFGYLVYRRQFSKQEKVKVNYDMSKLPEGNYRFGIYKKYELVCSKDITIEREIQTKINTRVFMVSK